MAISLIKADAYFGAGSSFASVNVSAGDLIVVWYNYNSASTNDPSDSSSNIYTAGAPANDGIDFTKYWYAVAGSANAALVVSFIDAGSYGLAVYHTTTGTWSFDTAKNAFASPGTTLSTASFTTTGAGVVAAFTGTYHTQVETLSVAGTFADKKNVVGSVSTSAMIVIDSISTSAQSAITPTVNSDTNEYYSLSALSFLVVSGIAFDAAGNSGDQAAASSYSGAASWSGANRMLAVDVSMLGPGVTVTSMTYGGAACTFVGSKSTVTSLGGVEQWRICSSDSGAPGTGSNTLVINLSGSIEFTAEWASYTGVHQSVPTEAFNSAQATNAGSATNASVAITSIADNCWIHAAVVANDTSITAGQTSRNNVSGTLGSGANEDNNAAVTPAGATTMSYGGMGITTTWAIAGYAIRPLSASGGATQITPNVGTLSIVGAASLVTQQINRIPAVAALVLTGLAAVVNNSPSITPSAGSLSITGMAASPSQQLFRAPTSGSIVISGVAPTVANGLSISPLSASLDLAGISPSQELGLPSPLSGSITLQGVQPVLTISGSSSITPSVGALALSPQNAVIGGVTNLVPLVGSIAFVSSSPTVTQQLSRSPGVGSLSLAGIAVTLQASVVATPGAGQLALGAYAPTLVYGTLTPTKGTLTLTGYGPSVNITDPNSAVPGFGPQRRMRLWL